MTESVNISVDQITERLHLSFEQIQDFCHRWQIRELALFGSILREDFNSNSDVDFLVSFTPEARVTFFDLDLMENQLSKILQREVDLVSKKSIEQSSNYIRRRNILNNHKVIYVQNC